MRQTRARYRPAVHILVATDADYVVNDVTAALGGPDVSFTIVREGRAVAAVVAERTPDLAILDLQIGSKGAMAVAMDLRLDASAGMAPDVKVLMLLDRQADIHLAKRSAADAWLLHQLGNGFHLLYYTDDASALDAATAAALAALHSGGIPVTALLVAAAGQPPAGLTTLHDSAGSMRERYDLRPGSAYLVRPDQHVAARWRAFSPAAVREWENSLLSRKPPLSQTTLKVYCRRLSAILNFAVKFYGLPYNLAYTPFDGHYKRMVK